MTIPTLADLAAAYDCSGLKVIVRFDWNVPVAQGAIVDTYRIDASMQTLAWLQERGAKVRIVSHIKNTEGSTLTPAVAYIQSKGIAARLVESIDDAAEVAAADAAGEVVVFENIRNEKGEEENSDELAKRIAQHADVYVNDAFSASHRSHASLVALAHVLPSFAGIQMQTEIEGLSKVFTPREPLIAIIGGAKFGTKLPLIDALRSQAKAVYVVGALAHDVYRARGFTIGVSPFSGEVDMAAIAADDTVIVPQDVVVTDEAFAAAGIEKDITAIEAGDRIVDAGSRFVQELTEAVSTAGTVVWNGPLGFYEKGYSQATDALAAFLKDVSADTILGGGDTLTAIARCGTPEEYTFVSTAGGAMLDFLSQGTLPAIAALQGARSVA